jgi:hypothetical protein
MTRVMPRIAVIASVVGLLLNSAAPGLAGYKPPRLPSRPKTASTTTGTRGCSSQTGIPVIAIAPQQHVGQTTSLYPTFTWFMPDEKSYPMEFELYELSDKSRKSLIRQPVQSQFGLMQFTLPKDRPALAIGKQYSWQVVVYCNKNRPSSALVAKAELMVQVPDPTLSAAMKTIVDPLIRADRYATEGFWYDAMREAVAVPGPKGKALRDSLFKDLAQGEEAKVQANLKQVMTLLK